MLVRISLRILSKKLTVCLVDVEMRHNILIHGALLTSSRVKDFVFRERCLEQTHHRTKPGS